MRRQSVAVAMVLMTMTLMAREARAQNAGDFLRDIFTGGAFLSDETDAIIALLQAQTTTFPLGSSAGGFTWTFDPQLGVATRRSNSFGPMFAERPLTNGRGKINVSLAYQHTDWKSIAGQDLKSGGLNYTFTSGGLSDVFSSELELTTDRTILTATFGVHDRVDIGVLVPIGRTKVTGLSRFRETRVPSGQLVFEDTIDASGSSSGIGDIELRVKAALPSFGPVDLAAGVDFRAPTGDEEKLLGTGKAQVKAMAIGSFTSGNASPHFNVGYTFAGGGIRYDTDGFSLLIDPTDEFDYNFGVDFAATPSVTVAGDVVGRLLFDSAKVERVTDSFGSFFVVNPDRVNLLLGTIGAKVKVGGMWLVTAAVAFPLNSNGVKPGVTPVIGFERAF